MMVVVVGAATMVVMTLVKGLNNPFQSCLFLAFIAHGLCESLVTCYTIWGDVTLPVVCRNNVSARYSNQWPSIWDKVFLSLSSNPCFWRNISFPKSINRWLLKFKTIVLGVTNRTGKSYGDEILHRMKAPCSHMYGSPTSVVGCVGSKTWKYISFDTI